MNLYYIFNNRKFSYPAAFSQSTNQRRNAGSFIAGFSISKHNLEFDYAELPAFILEAMNPAMKVNNIKYTNANISFGYAYNWVFARNCLACLSLTPAIAYKASDVDAETHEGKTWYGNFNLDFLIRAGVVYNNGKYFVGTSFAERIIITTGTISHWTTGSEHYRYTSDSISIYARSIEEKIQDKGCV